MKETSIFLCIPNNSGSTFVYRSITTQCDVSFLPTEGQFIDGFCGPVPAKYGFMMHWGFYKKFTHETLNDSSEYNWEAIKKSWNRALLGTSSVFVEKSPPNIARTHILKENFQNCKLIFSVRNPYAVADGIHRAVGNKCTFYQIAEHLITVMRLQKENIRKYPEDIFFTYEELCNKPDKVSDKIKKLAPTSLKNLNFKNKINVKHRYLSGAKNFNDVQINNLTKNQINILNDIFYKNKDIIEYFGYKIIQV